MTVVTCLNGTIVFFVVNKTKPITKDLHGLRTNIQNSMKEV